MQGIIRNSVSMSRHILNHHIKPGDLAIDATCGRGQDTLFLARLVGKTGRVFAFDIQGQAIHSTYCLVRKQGWLDVVVMIKDDHSNMADHLSGNTPKACVFNLGYMPEGDHDIITTPHSTISALKNSLDILAADGVVSLVFYTGHPGGQEEYEAINDYVSGLSQSKFTVLKLEFINQINSPPGLILIHKFSEDKR